MTTATITPTDGQTTELNGINPKAVQALIDTVAADPKEGQTHWDVTTRWQGGCITETEVAGFKIGDKQVDRSFKFTVDEPHEIGGTNTHANPQEYLLGAVNACMAVTYVALASLQGIAIESLEIQTQGDIDLRGLFALDDQVKPGYDQLHYSVKIKGDGTPQQFQEIHETVKKTSPNYFNLAQAVRLNADLVVE